jgi:hypothetical protein
MVDKKILYRIWKDIRHLRPRAFFILAVVCGIVCIFALRANNERMIALRNEVYAADKAGGDVNGALRKLQAFVYGHMNTDLAAGPNAVHPPIQLKYTYDRLVAAENQDVQTANRSLYPKAQAYCQAQIPTGFSGGVRENCINQYVKTHGVKVVPVQKSLYEFDFVAPKWSPDVAGWSMVLAVTLFLSGVGIWAFEDYIRRKLKQHE